MIELRVLGTVDLRDRSGDGPVRSVLAQPKRTALLCYLAIATPRGLHHRESLFPLFWPESSQERARNSLNQAVFHLRRSLGERALTSTTEEVGLGPEAVWCDAAAFDDALQAGDPRLALSLYGGTLLPGFHVDGCAEFEHWLDSERERRHRQAVETALSVADELERSGNDGGALELLGRAAAWAPYDERVAVRFISLLARLGDRAGALQAYDRLRALLADDLEIEPSAETQALVARLREQGADRPPLASPAAAPAAADQEAGLAPDLDSTRTSDVEASVRRGTEAESAPDVAAAGVRGMEQRHPPMFSRSPAGTHVPGEPGAPPRRRWRRRVLAAGVTGVAAVGAALLFAPRTGPEEPAAPLREGSLEPRRVLVAAFENRTGDPALDPLGYMASDWIAQALARSGMAHVVPFSTVVQETPHLTAEAAAPEVVQPAANRELAQRIGAGTLIAGAYYRSGEEVVFQAQVIDAGSGELLRGIDEIRGSLDRPAAAVELLQQRCLGALATLFDERLESWPDPGGQPSSLEAYRLFSEGMGLFLSAGRDLGTAESAGRLAAAAARFHEAAALDSAFTTPLLWAGFAHLNRGDRAATESVIRTLEGRRVSPWSRAVLDHLSALLAGDWEGAYRTARVLAELSPDSEWLFKLGFAAHETRRSGEALDALLRVDPDRGWIKEWSSYWRVRAEVQHVVGDAEAALADARRGRTASPDDPWLRTLELRALAALGRADELLATMEDEFAAGDGAALWHLTLVVEELRAHGHAAADRLLARALPAAEAATARDGSRSARGDLARLLEQAGRDDEAGAQYRALIAERPEGAEFQVRHAVVAARQGNPGPAREVAEWLAGLDDETLDRVAPSALQLRYLWGPREAWLALMRARVAAQLGDEAGAVELLQDAVARGLRHTYLHLHTHPDFDGLRDHAGFEALLRPRG